MGRQRTKDYQVSFTHISDRPKRPKRPRPAPVQFKKLGNVRRARFSGMIATVCDGRRIVKQYYSGEPLLGYIE